MVPYPSTFELIRSPISERRLQYKARAAKSGEVQRGPKEKRALASTCLIQFQVHRLPMYIYITEEGQINQVGGCWPANARIDRSISLDTKQNLKNEDPFFLSHATDGKY